MELQNVNLKSTWTPDTAYKFREYCQSRGWSVSAAALAWVLAQDEHLIAIPGTRSAAHLVQNTAGSDLDLTETDLAEIEQILPVGFAHGDRYSEAQLPGVERYC